MILLHLNYMLPNTHILSEFLLLDIVIVLHFHLFCHLILRIYSVNYLLFLLLYVGFLIEILQLHHLRKLLFHYLILVLVQMRNYLQRLLLLVLLQIFLLHLLFQMNHLQKLLKTHIVYLLGKFQQIRKIYIWLYYFQSYFFTTII